MIYIVYMCHLYIKHGCYLFQAKARGSDTDMNATEVHYPDGGKYNGPIREDSGLPHGVGIKILPDGSKYAGNIQSGLFQGCGVMTFPDGSK